MTNGNFKLLKQTGKINAYIFSNIYFFINIIFSYWENFSTKIENGNSSCLKLWKWKASQQNSPDETLLEASGVSEF